MLMEGKYRMMQHYLRTSGRLDTTEEEHVKQGKLRILVSSIHGIYKEINVPWNKVEK